jgi:hypothetical protein
VQKTFEDVTTDNNDGVEDDIPNRVKNYKLNSLSNELKEGEEGRKRQVWFGIWT